MTILFYILALFSGICLSIEAALGGILSDKTGAILSTFYIFLMGTVLLLLIVLFFGKGNFKLLPRNHTWQLMGGILGASGVIMLFVSIASNGVSITLTCVIIGQLITSMLVEHWGLFNTTKTRISWNRIIAILLLFIALYFIL